MSSSTERAAGGGGPASPPDRVPASPADPASPAGIARSADAASPAGAAAEPRHDEAAEPQREDPHENDPRDGEPRRADPERGTGGPHEVVRFLPSGRAGLAPESVTIDPEPDNGDDAGADPSAPAGQQAPAGERATAGQQTAAGQQAPAGQTTPRTEVAGAPPWAAEPVAQEPGAPPPWESGPWPSRGADSPDNGMPESADWPADAAETAYDIAVPDDIRDPPGYHPLPPDDSAEPARSNRLATGALVAGIAGILVVPGLVLGVLGLRRARVTGIGTVQSWLGIAASLVWAIGIVVVVTLPGGGSSRDPGCTGYQSASAAVSRATSALAVGAPAGQLRSDLGQAAGPVNSAAATAQDMSVRSALSVMTGDLQAALGEVNSGRPVPAVLKTALHHDAAAAGRLCGGRSA
jgi:hypothetical protein